MLTHDELCERARRWLSGTRRCHPVFSQCASCEEIPDAIGWSSAWGWKGSTVIECKTSVSDFRADKKKRFMWKHPQHDWRFGMDRFSKKRAKEDGYELVEVPMMGDYRFYFCEAGVLPESMVAEQAPDHGLIYKEGQWIRIVRPAPKREMVDKDSEIRFLRFAIINAKKPYEPPAKPSVPLLFDAADESRQSL